MRATSLPTRTAAAVSATLGYHLTVVAVSIALLGVGAGAVTRTQQETSSVAI